MVVLDGAAKTDEDEEVVAAAAKPTPLFSLSELASCSGSGELGVVMVAAVFYRPSSSPTCLTLLQAASSHSPRQIQLYYYSVPLCCEVALQVKGEHKQVLPQIHVRSQMSNIHPNASLFHLTMLSLSFVTFEVQASSPPPKKHVQEEAAGFEVGEVCHMHRMIVVQAI